jgi:hypothetical protein
MRVKIAKKVFEWGTVYAIDLINKDNLLVQLYSFRLGELILLHDKLGKYIKKNKLK